jgi:hypothetical protein
VWARDLDGVPITRNRCRIAAWIGSSEKFPQGMIWTLLARNGGTFWLSTMSALMRIADSSQTSRHVR